MLVHHAQDALRPVPLDAFAVLMDPFLDWMELCGIGNLPDDPDARQDRVARIVRMYHADLGHLPADLLEIVLTQTRQRHKWPRLPNPADMLEIVATELERRRFVKRRAEAALRTSRFEEPQFKPRPSDEDKARVKAVNDMIRQASASFSAGSHAMPKREDDGREPVDLREAYSVLTGVPFVQRAPRAAETGDGESASPSPQSPEH